MSLVPDWLPNAKSTVICGGLGGEHPTACVYHQTRVVSWSSTEIKLDSGGHRTATTKKRMNQVSESFALGFFVFQKAGEWYVRRDIQVIPFTDGMVFARKVD